MIQRRLTVVLSLALAAASFGQAIIVTPASAHVSRAEARAWKPDLAAAHRWGHGREGQISIAAIDMAGRHREAHARVQIPMASTFKVMLLVAYLGQPAVRSRDLEGWERDLLRPMIRNSDDVAATRVRDLLGPGPITALARQSGMDQFSYNPVWGLSLTSAADQARFMRHLRALTPERHWRFARRQLERITPSQRWGIGQVHIPGIWRLAFKGGWGSGSGAVEHQVVRLTAGRRRIAVAVMTTASPSHRYATETLRGVFTRLLRGLPR